MRTATVVQPTRALARAAMGAEALAASVVLRHAQRADSPEQDVLDPLERLELADLIARAESFGLGLADR